MQRVGIYILIFGIALSAFKLMDLQSGLLGMTEMWGPTVGWIIRGSLIVIGLVMIMMNRNNS